METIRTENKGRITFYKRVITLHIKGPLYVPIYFQTEIYRERERERTLNKITTRAIL